MISLYDGQISDLLTNGARYNQEIKALAYAVLQEKQRIIEQAQRTRTLSMIDELPESILDILAVELRTPFYQGDFTVASKRELIRETLVYYTYMGTPEAVNRMLSVVFPGSGIEEWYTYGGQPYHFQVILEMSGFRETANAATIIKAVKKVKRLTAHLDGLVYQCNIGMAIRTHGQGYKYRSPRTGGTWAGTQPWRNKHGRPVHWELEAATSGKGFMYDADMTGTKPWRDIRGGMEHEELEVGSDANGWAFTSELSGRAKAGTVPYRNERGGYSAEILLAGTEAGGFLYESASAGTEPKRSTKIKTEVAGIDVASEGKAHRYKSIPSGKAETGTVPKRAQPFRNDDGGIQVTASAQGFTYTVQASGKEESGTEPQRRMMGGDSDGAFFTSADGQGYPYRIIMCGTAYCNNKRRRSLC